MMIRSILFVAIARLVFLTPAWANVGTGPEVIGPFTIRAAPVSARLILQQRPWGWLNVVNSPVTIDQAFTGFSVIDDGYANGFAPMILELTFASGTAVNYPGPDLVLFDARFSPNSYEVSTGYDGFTSKLPLPDTVFIDTGVQKDYYYELNSDLNRARVMAAAIDLSDLAVPAGASVTHVQVRGTSNQVDPLGLGSLVPEPTTFSVLALGGLLGVVRHRPHWRRSYFYP